MEPSNNGILLAKNLEHQNVHLVKLRVTFGLKAGSRPSVSSVTSADISRTTRLRRGQFCVVTGQRHEFAVIRDGLKLFNITHKNAPLINQGAYAGIIRSYNVLFSFYIYKAIRKSYFCLFFSERSYKGLIFGS